MCYRLPHQWAMPDSEQQGQTFEQSQIAMLQAARTDRTRS